jgi:putative ABC transport system permease protein
MIGSWDELTVAQQDVTMLIALICPGLLVGFDVLRGVRPYPLVKAMLWRFRWANILFTLLIAISVGIGVGLLAQERGLRRGSAAAAEKFDLIVAAPGSEITMLMAAVYLQPSDVPLLSAKAYNHVASHQHVSIAAPLGFGDSYNGTPIIGTIPQFVIHLSDGLLVGENFRNHSSAIIGARVQLNIGDQFVPAHGMAAISEDNGHGHETQLTVVGRMPVTGTPWDRSILVPIETIWEIHGLPNGHADRKEEQPEPIGPPFDLEFFPGTPAIIVHADELWANYALRSEFSSDPEMMAFFPGTVLTRLYGIMGDIRQTMSLMSLTTQVLVAISVLAGLLILIRLFQRQLALLRALGAPKRFIFAVVWTYATILLTVGSGMGLLMGQAATLVLSKILTAKTDIAIEAPLSWPELHFIAGFISSASVLALAPAVLILRKRIVSGLRG